jgi:hypothetical protein
MGDHLWLARTLREHLLSALSVPPGPLSLNAVVIVAHRLAVAGLISKRAAGTLADFQGLSVEDLAYDCIADLFQRGDGGEVIQLRSYFAGIDLASTEDEQLLILYRRLVLGKVSNGVFRMFNEIDPALGRILRNVKLGIGGLRSFEEVERFGEPCIVPIVCDPLQHLPPPTREQLVDGLRSAVAGTARVPDLLAALASYLRTQTEHSRTVPLMHVAMTFRDLFVMNRPLLQEHVELTETFTIAEITETIRIASRAVKHEYRRLYVETRNVPDDEWDTYFSVIEANLRRKFCENDGSEYSLFRGIVAMVPGLTREEYKRSHRAKIEHLHSLVESRFLDAVKKQ